eukprot:GHVR01128512.1.p1 GENE.GHVR01128512.1~~GHVR01128512.1.p1  ORF type:complete len:194 (-),score=34.45 GHVR01128512.1:151-732(-)
MFNTKKTSRGFCCLSLRNAVLVIAILAIANGAQNMFTGGFFSIVSIVFGTIGMIAALQKDYGLLKLFYYFEVVNLVLGIGIFILGVLYLLVGIESHDIREEIYNQIVSQNPQMHQYFYKKGNEVEIDATTLYCLIGVLTIFAVVCTVIQCYFILLTKALLNVLECGGTGEEFKSSDDFEYDVNTHDDPLINHV